MVLRLWDLLYRPQLYMAELPVEEREWEEERRQCLERMRTDVPLPIPFLLWKPFLLKLNLEDCFIFNIL